VVVHVRHVRLQAGGDLVSDHTPERDWAHEGKSGTAALPPGLAEDGQSDQLGSAAHISFHALQPLISGIDWVCIDGTQIRPISEHWN